MRIESDHPMRNGGWLHRQNGRHAAPPRRREPKAPRATTNELTAIWTRWRDAGTNGALSTLATVLGVSDIALDVLGAAWAPGARAWAFPMRDASGTIIGIRYRAESGHKWAFTGSRSGLFIPDCPAASNTLYVCEGPTDTAAALTLGVFAIGRPSCRGQEDMVNSYVQRNRFCRVIIIADHDDHAAGVNGAERLQAALRVPSCILIPPVKDLRAMVQAGYDYSVLRALEAGLR